MYLLDTNILSDLRKAKSHKSHANLAKWIKSHPESSFFISAITLVEIETGILLIERRDPAQGALLREWFETHVLTTFEKRILSVDLDVAKQCASLHVPNRRPEHDALIAATALTHGLIVVTRNLVDFEPMGVEVFNPWEAENALS